VTNHSRWTAAARHLVRRWWGQDPGFTLVMLSLSSLGALFFRGNLVKKVVTGYSGDIFPNFSPNPWFADAYLRGEVEVDAGQTSGRFVQRIWLEPPVAIHPAVSKAITEFDAVIIGPGSFYTSLMPIFLVRGVAEALATMRGPVILIANLLTEGRGMVGFTAADAVARIEEAIQRPVDVVLTNVAWPSPQVLGRYALEHKEPLAPGTLPDHCEVVGGEFWTGDIARHDRLRLAYALWSVLSRRLLKDA